MDMYPLIVNLILEQDGKILFLYRDNTPSFSKIYGLPAGKADKGESVRQNVIREAYEELGICIEPDDLNLAVTLSAKYTYKERHVEDIGFFFTVDAYSGTITNMEPHKHSHFKWFEKDNLPENTNIFVRSAIHAYVQGKNYIEVGFDQPVSI